MESRPKIKLILSPLDNGLELIAKLYLLVMWCLTFYVFLKSPGTIPTHFNATGQVDDYGNKLTLLILPIVATVIYVGLTQLNKYPHLFNYMTKITENNAQEQYSIATRMFRYMKLAILIIFSLIILFTYLTTLGLIHGLGFWFLPLTCAVLVIPTAIIIGQSIKKSKNVQ